MPYNLFINPRYFFVRFLRFNFFYVQQIILNKINVQKIIIISIFIFVLKIIERINQNLLCTKII